MIERKTRSEYRILLFVVPPFVIVTCVLFCTLLYPCYRAGGDDVGCEPEVSGWIESEGFFGWDETVLYSVRDVSLFLDTCHFHPADDSETSSETDCGDHAGEQWHYLGSDWMDEGKPDMEHRRIWVQRNDDGSGHVCVRRSQY